MREKLTNQEQIRLIRTSRKQGFNPANLTDAQYKAMAVVSRLTNPVRLVRDASSAAASYVRTTYFHSVVPLPIYQERESKCVSNKCGNYIRLKDNAPACAICNCSNNMLRSKWRDPTQACSATPAAKDAAEFYWSEYTRDDAIRDGYLTEEGERIDPKMFEY